jgi:hypothetical protein
LLSKLLAKVDGRVKFNFIQDYICQLSVFWLFSSAPNHVTDTACLAGSLMPRSIILEGSSGWRVSVRRRKGAESNFQMSDFFIYRLKVRTSR